MSKFQQGFNQENLKQARIILNKHLAAAALEMGVPTFGIGSISFNPNEMTTKISIISKKQEVAAVITEEIGSIFKSPNAATKYELAEVRATEVIVKTMRRGGKKYRVSTEEFANWIKCGE